MSSDMNPAPNFELPPSTLDPFTPRGKAAQVLLDASMEFQGQDLDRRVDDAYFEEQALHQVDALIQAGWTPPITPDMDAVRVVAELLRPFKLRLGPNTVESIQRGMRDVYLTGSEREWLAEAALTATRKAASGRG